nr:retrovirus-related Pol polyprotein from transposon TNT 1-94 [Tanacetum cinerariifolium]
MVTKFDIDKFDGKISFAIWKVHMQAVLTHHGYKKDLKGIAHKPQILQEIIHETIATGLWLKLESLYMTKSLANKLRLKDRLYTFRMKPGTSVQDHLDEFNTILTDLENLDVDIDDEDKAYDDDVEPESGEGLVARDRSSDRGKGNNEKKPEKATEVAIAKGDSDNDVYLAIDTKKSRDELIVDSDCTFHMIPHRSWFTTYESFNCGALVLMKAIQSGGLYVLQGTVVYGTAGVATSKASLDDSNLWYYRLGQMGEKGMKNLAKKGLIKVSCNLEFCEHCVFGKQKRISFSPGIHKTRDALDYIHSDLWGPSPVTSRGGKKIKKSRTDNGLEFCGEIFNALCKKYGIARHHTLVRTPQQNGVAKRMNRTIMEKVRCMLSRANLDKDFWIEDATTATYLINRSPHRSLDGNIPEILWSGNSVDYSNLRVFGCPIYVHVNEGKLVPRAVKCIFLGYGFGVKGYRVWCPDPKYCKIIHSRDVTFNEDVIINSGKDFVPPHNVDNNHIERKVEFEFDVENRTHTQPLFNDEHIETQDDGNMPTSPQSQPQTEYILARDHERRQVKRPSRLKDYQCDLVVAMEEEVESLHKNETWELVKLSKEKRVISCKWLFKVKDGIPGVESNRYKARYVVRGFDQREGIDFNEVFSLIVRHTSIRVLLSIVALQDLELEQFDVKTTFLHGHLEEEIYVEQPEGFKVPRKEDHVYRLKKSLYGLNQSPQKWYKSCKPVPIPLAPHFKLSSHECPKSEEDMSRVPYSSAVGSLMYAMVCTRPDLAYAVSVVSRYMHNPGKMHWEAVKCMLRYLKWTSNIGLSFEKGCASPNEVVGYVDSDYAGDLNARKSLSSYIFSHCSSAISWYSSLQAIIALSTTKAEYISYTEGVKEAIWL